VTAITLWSKEWSRSPAGALQTTCCVGKLRRTRGRYSSSIDAFSQVRSSKLSPTGPSAGTRSGPLVRSAAQQGRWKRPAEPSRPQGTTGSPSVAGRPQCRQRVSEGGMSRPSSVTLLEADPICRRAAWGRSSDLEASPHGLTHGPCNHTSWPPRRQGRLSGRPPPHQAHRFEAP